MFAAKETRGQKLRVAVVGDGSKHASLVSTVGGDTIHIYKYGYLLKGKYPQLQVLEPPFPEGVTLDRLRGLHVSMTKAGVAYTVSFF